MKRFHSIRLKLKRKFGDSSHISNLGVSRNKSISISTVLELAIDSRRSGPSAQQLNTLAKHSLYGDVETYKLYHLLLEYLSPDNYNAKNYAQLNNILTILHYIFIAGGEKFYNVFNHEQGIWKLRAISATIISNDLNDHVIDRLRDLILMCDNGELWRKRREEHAAIRNEINTPVSRHSFDSSYNFRGTNNNNNYNYNYNNLILPYNNNNRFKSFSMELERIQE